MNASNINKVTASNGKVYSVKEFKNLRCPVCGSSWFNYSNITRVEFSAAVNGLWIMNDGSVLYPDKTAKDTVTGGIHKLTCVACGTTYTSASPLLCD